MTRHFKCGRTQCVCVNEMFGPERPGGVGRSDNEGKEYGSEEGLGGISNCLGSVFRFIWYSTGTEKVKLQYCSV